MGWLEKEKVLHQRDGEGKLLPITIPLEELKEIGIEENDIQVLPATRGELLKHWRDVTAEEDKEKSDILIQNFVLAHIVKPELTIENFNDSTFFTLTNPKTKKKEQRSIVDVLMNAINKVSGIRTLEEAEEELKKN